MADRRKLQGEVERVIKKVNEGSEAFDDIWEKVQNATNVNQKEKYEAELKREIKKLQRLREQIKTWAASSDIKDKKTLLDNRKLIELQMERFRVVEKETKTKAYSKEGLGQANKIDPETKEFEKCREWINEALKKLEYQIDLYETECESLHAGTKKKKLDKDKLERVEELTDRIEKHRYHITQLEHILRLLDNHSLEVDLVNKVKEDVEYYIDNCQEPDFLDDEGIYDDLDLDPETDLEASLKMDGDKEDDLDTEPSPSSSLNSGNVYSPANKSSLCSPRKNSKSSNGIPSTMPSKRNLFASPSVTTLSHHIDPSSSVTVTDSQPKLNGLDHSDNDYMLVKPDQQTAPYAVAAAVPTSIVAKDTRPTSPTNKVLLTTEQSAVQVVRNHVEGLKYPERAGYSQNNANWRKSSSSSASSIPDTSDVFTTNPLLNTATTPGPEPIIPMDSLPSESVHSTSRPVSSTSTSLVTTSCNDDFQPIIIHKHDEQPPLDFSLTATSFFGGTINQPGLSQKSADTQEVRLQPVHGVAPLGPVSLTPERVYQLKLLDASFHHQPQRQDSERMRPYISRSAVPIASYHLHQAPPNIDSIEFFQRLSTETLFFIFYYQEGTRAQYLAAKALKKQSWRFHTKYMMWFQRHEEPKRITDEFEEGTYIFFDYEKWSQRKRDGFTFEYRFLEDKDLP